MKTIFSYFYLGLTENLALLQQVWWVLWNPSSCHFHLSSAVVLGFAVHIMADYLAESRQCHQQILEGRGWRRRSKEADVAMFIGQIRCTLSLEAVKAHARL